MAKISVIIPVYNTAPYLPRCLDSVLAQTHSDLEIIVVDDGSADGSGEICDKYARADKRVLVIHQANKGVSAARNAGLDAASGEWIGFADSDDVPDKDIYAKLLANASNCKISICGHTKYCTSGRVKNQTANLPKIIEKHKAMDILQFSDKYYEGFLWNKIFHMSILKDLRFDENIHFCEDLLFCTHAFMKISKAAYLAESLYNYHIREDGAMMSFNEKRLTELLARKRIIDITGSESAKVFYTSALIEICGMDLPKYCFSKHVRFKRKMRSLIILLMPKLWKRLENVQKRFYS